MKRGYKANRIYQVRCESGIMGWRTRLRNNYNSFEEWYSYSGMYGRAERLGYKFAFEAWEQNPVVEGSVNATDFRVASPKTS